MTSVTNTDGLLLCNSPQKRSAIAYYRDFSRHLNGVQPDDLVYVSDGEDRTWEGDAQSVTFSSSGVVFNWNINDNAGSEPSGQVVGIADNTLNGSVLSRYVIVRGPDTVVVTDNDGVELEVIYLVN